MSSMELPKLLQLWKLCGWWCLLPIMSDEAMIVDKTVVFS
jgi:hypothetical protein